MNAIIPAGLAGLPKSTLASRLIGARTQLRAAQGALDARLSTVGVAKALGAGAVGGAIAGAIDARLPALVDKVAPSCIGALVLGAIAVGAESALALDVAVGMIAGAAYGKAVSFGVENAA